MFTPCAWHGQTGGSAPIFVRRLLYCATLRAQSNQRAGSDPLDVCGARTIFTAGLSGTMRVHGMSVGSLASVASGDVRRPVLDKTGLTGAFDWDFTWTPQPFLQGTFNNDRFPSIDPGGPSIFTALQEQLGLKLVSEKDDQPVLIIDHVEHPSEN